MSRAEARATIRRHILPGAILLLGGLVAGCAGTKPMLPLPPEAGEPPPVRVGLLVHVPSVRLGSPGAFTVSDRSGVLAAGHAGEAIVLARVGDRVRVTNDSGDGIAEAAGPFRVQADARGSGVTVDGRRYPQRLEIVRSRAGGLNVINVVDVETYLRAVVPLEIGHDGQYLEAAKAQAIAARTYVARHLGRYREEGFDVEAGVNDQVYGSMDKRDSAADRAVTETRGLILVYHGRPIRANYSSTCGGRIAGVEESFDSEKLPYLRPHEDRVDGKVACRTSRYYRWKVTWSEADLLRIFSRTIPKITGRPWKGTRIRAVEVLKRGRSGRAVRLAVRTDRASYVIGKGAIRAALERPGGGLLRSTAFQLSGKKKQGRLVRLTAEGRGWGHGVGMCQWGAMQLSKDGYDYRFILDHYYPGTKLELWYDGFRASQGETP